MSGGLVRTPDGLVLAVRLTPGAARDAIEGWRADAAGARHLAVRVRAVPEKGRANAALIALLGKVLGIPKRDIDVIRGATSRLKTVQVTAGPADRDRLADRLERTGA